MGFFNWAIGSADRLGEYLFESPAAARQREERLQTMDEAISWCRVFTVTGIALAILGLGLLSSSVVGGLFVIGLGASVVVLSHDFCKAGGNYCEIGRVASVRGKVLNNPDAYVEQIFKDTWIIGVFFEDDLKKSLRTQRR